MSSRVMGLERVLLGLFVASGFAGLIYQAIWSHYLGLSLGHAAYSQTLVLAMFMGGMALGAWLVSWRGVRWSRLIAAYAVVEILVGLAGIAFHPVFVTFTGFSQETVYPSLSSPEAVRVWQWAGAALLIAPQSVLLGMTFPLMSGGYLRVAPKADGEILGGLYFTNSVGAAFGALFATFVLLPWIGMPGAVVFAGIVNLLVGVLAALVSRQADKRALTASPEPSAKVPEKGLNRLYPAMLLAAGITGASSFVYEIGWVRMWNQALGTTIHSFELMLSAFILGLAFGGLWIRRRSHAVKDPVAYAGYAQIWMGVAALVSLPVFAQSFHWVGALMGMVPRTDSGYSLFSLGSAGIALLVMFPAAFFAGMTLPLFTMALLRRGGSEASIGRIYAANTLGAIVGVALAVHVLIPVMGLQLAVTVAALADIGLGLVLLRVFSAGMLPQRYLGALVATLAALGVSLVFGRADPRVLASGVFRTGEATLEEGVRVDFLRDGKTATVAVLSGGSWRAIATNGKPDAALDMDPAGTPAGDEITMLMLGSLPLAVHPAPRRIGVIGWGSGLTTHTLLGSAVPRQVDSVEIEQAMVDGATLFGERVGRAYRDPRSQLWIDDARTYFSTGAKTYDVIVSEPSNPWVSGVSSLFTRQFYGFLSRHLNEGGVVIQWVHLYELDDPLLAKMIAALIDEFPHVDAYLANHSDLILAASHESLDTFAYPAERGSDLEAELARVGLAGEADFQVRRLGSRRLLESIVRLSGAQPHDDYYPTVSLEAPKARFKGSAATWLIQLLQAGVPLAEMMDSRRAVPVAAPLAEVGGSPALDAALDARRVRATLRGEHVDAPFADPDLARALQILAGAPPAPGEPADEWLLAAAKAAEFTLADIRPEDADGVWVQPRWIRGDGLSPEVQRVLDAYSATARRDAEGMHEHGREALESLLAAGAPAKVCEQMLVIARLGALAAGDPQGSLALERTFGRSVPIGGDSNLGLVRALLMAMADE